VGKHVLLRCCVDTVFLWLTLVSARQRMLAGPLIRDCFFRLLITVLRSTCKGNCSWSELYSNSGEEQVQQPASCVCVCVCVCVCRGLWSHIQFALYLTSFQNICFLTFLVMSFAVQLASDLVFTPFVWRQRHGIKVSPPVTCVMLMISKMNKHVLFHCVNPHVISLGRKHASLFPQIGSHDASTFISQNNNKSPFFSRLIVFYEQAHSLTEGL
jgi:hypothetical protein